MKDLITPPAVTAASNPRAISVRIEGRSQSQLYGQRNHDYRKGWQPLYVDQSRMHLNAVLVAPRPVAEVRKEAIARRGDRGRAMRTNACIATIGIITFGAEAALWVEELSREDQHDLFLDVATAIANRLNTSLEGLVVHHDETSLHAHFELLGYSVDGKPVSKVATPMVLSEMQDVAAAAAQPFCPRLERGNKKRDRLAAGADYAATLHRSVRQLHQDLPIELAAKQEAVASEKRTLADLQASIEKTKRYLAKLQERAVLSEKELKRVSVYQARIEKTHAEIEARHARARAAMAAEKAELIAGQEDLGKARQALAVEKAEVQAAKAFIADVTTEFTEGRIAINKTTGKLAFQNPPPTEHLSRSFMESILSPIANILTFTTAIVKKERWITKMVERIQKLMPSLTLNDPVRQAAAEVVKDWEERAPIRHNSP